MKNTTIFFVLVFTFIVIVLGVPTSKVVEAAKITFNYTANSVVGNTVLTGQFGWDDSTPNGWNGVYNNAAYYEGDSFWSGSFNGDELHGTSFNWTDLDTQVFDDWAGGGGSDGVHLNDNTNYKLFSALSLSSGAGTAQAGTAIPTDINLSDWDSSIYDIAIAADDFLGGASVNSPFTRYTFSSIRLAQMSTVPEPSTILLLSIAVAGLAGYRYQRKNRERVSHLE